MDKEEAVLVEPAELNEAGVLDSRSPLEIEAELILQQEKESIEKIKNMKPEDFASTMFQAYYPIYKRLISHIPNKDARVMADYLVGYPLELSTSDLEFKDSDSKRAFGIALRLMEAKQIMMGAAEMDKLQAMKDKEDSGENDNDSNANLPEIKNELVFEEIGETENG